MTAEQIARYYSELSRRATLHRENALYAEGKNPHIARMTRRRDPDNRLALPFAKMAIADMCGYAGRPGDRQWEVDNIATDETAEQDASRDDFIDAVKATMDRNETELETAELYREALVQGAAYELVWATEEIPGAGMMAEYAMLPSDGVVMIRDDTIRRKPVAAVWYHDETDQAGATVTIADAYYPFTSERWALYAGRWSRDPEGDTRHPFDRVPVIEYAINRDRQSFFEAEKGILFAIDKLLSSSINEIDRFNALIALFPFDLDEELTEKLREMNAIGSLEAYERWPEYLEKNLGAVDGFYNSLADRLERLFHKSIKVPDFSDENFAGNSSGVALGYKLLAMEFVAAQVDAYFDRGVNARYELIEQAINAGGRQWPIEDYELIIRNKRNLPIDEEAKVRVAQALLGIVSRETVLRMLPASIVEDVEREMQRLDEEPSLTLGPMDEPEEADDDEDA